MSHRKHLRRPAGALRLVELPATGTRGFTLVELLVVVTIAVLLLALLAPALDQAVYQAELAVCAANLKAIGSGAASYTLDNDRTYPHRFGRATAWPPYYLFTRVNQDERKMIRSYFPLNATLNDPLSRAVDIAGSRSDPLSDVYLGYSLWYGWQYTVDGAREKGMLRLGDRWEWADDGFSILAGDTAGLSVPNWGHGSHPDGKGVWFNEVWQDEVPTWRRDLVDRPVTMSWWYNAAARPGPIDVNFTFQDGSTHRLNQVVYTEGEPGEQERVTRVPTNGDASIPQRLLQAPRQ